MNLFNRQSFILFLLLPVFFPAQNRSESLNLKNLNYALIESEFMERLNQLRKDQNLSILTTDNILKKAAKDQADYQQKKHFLTHQQTVKQKETPQKRVFFYSGTHDIVGENCIKIPLKTPYKTKYKKEVTVNTYSEAGEALFQGWKHSPGHYKNMITADYDVSGLGFSFDADSNFLYCAQVFGAKPFPFSIEYQSPADAFGVKEEFGSVCQSLQSSDGVRARKNMSTVISGDSVFLRSEDLPALKKFFNLPNDGIYFDIVQRKQFVCEKNNLLHGSPIYDGKMTQPVYFADIFKKNRAKDPKDLYAPICKIPKRLLENNNQLSYGIIKNGYSCEYTYLVNIPEDNLAMLALYPKWVYIHNLEVQTDSFDGNLSFILPFERGEISLQEKNVKILKEKLDIYRPFIKNANLQTFSSVEGSSQANIKLQEQRSQNILSILKQYIPGEVSVNQQTMENWDEFFLQIENSPQVYLKNLTKDQIKEKLKSKTLLDSLDYVLRMNRCARLNLSIKAHIHNNSNPYLLLAAYKKSIDSGDSLKAFTYQNRILWHIGRYEFNRSDLLPVEVPLSKKFLPHLTNYLAVAVKDDELVYSYRARDLAVKAAKIDSNYLPARFNSCIMALRYLHEFQDTIYPLPQLEKYMKSCFKLASADDSIIVNHMLLNYHLLSLYRNWQYHFYQNLDRHLNAVKEYYPGAHISEQEAIQLGLLFNLYSRHQWTTELLLPYVRRKTKNEDLLFLFVETNAAMSRSAVPDAEFEKYLKKAKAMNEMRFTEWIDKRNYQLLRKDIIKKEFCDLKK